MKPTMTARHDGIVQVLSDWVTRIGGACQVEPRLMFNTQDRPDQSRVDIRVALGGLNLLIDVAVIHPTSPSRIGGRPVMVPLGTTVEAENGKRGIYDARARAVGATFVPFVVETYGGIGEGAQHFMKSLAKFASTSGAPWSYDEALACIRTEIAMAIHRGKTRVVEKALQRSTTARWDAITRERRRRRG
jgi:hypothetical protein